MTNKLNFISAHFQRVDTMRQLGPAHSCNEKKPKSKQEEQSFMENQKDDLVTVFIGFVILVVLFAIAAHINYLEGLSY